MSQQDNSRAAVDRLLAELAATDDRAHAEGLVNQIRLHAELAGLSPDDLEKLVDAASKPAPAPKPARAPKPDEG